MPIGFTGVKAPDPWFAVLSPWPWFGRLTKGSTISVGNPQHVLTPGAATLGFNFDVGANLSTNAAGSSSATVPLPPTDNAVFNLSAAQIASAPAFSKRPAYEF